MLPFQFRGVFWILRNIWWHILQTFLKSTFKDSFFWSGFMKTISLYCSHEQKWYIIWSCKDNFFDKVTKIEILFETFWSILPLKHSANNLWNFVKCYQTKISKTSINKRKLTELILSVEVHSYSSYLIILEPFLSE